MGKGSKAGGGKKGGGYVHKHNPNPKARDSDQRRLEQIQTMRVKQHQRAVANAKRALESYVPPDAAKKAKVDPLWDLKGAARPAREYYKDPNSVPMPDPVNLLEQYKGRHWDHEGGKHLLSEMLKLAWAVHQINNRTKEAIGILKEMMSMDPQDHLLARQRLLRCYLDMAEADEARALMDKYPDDSHCCFSYNRALIEHISLMLGEEGASLQVKDEALQKAYEKNPYAIWLLAYHDIFFDSLEGRDAIPDEIVGEDCFKDIINNGASGSGREGTLEDAISFFDIDVELWLDTDGAVEWIQDFIKRNSLKPTLIGAGNGNGSGESGVSEGGDNEGVKEDDDDDEEEEGDDDDDEDEDDDINAPDLINVPLSTEEGDRAAPSEAELQELHDYFVDRYNTVIKYIIKNKI